MENFQAMIAGAWEIFNLPLTLFGFTFTWFNVVAVFCVCSIILWFIGRFID